MIGVNLKVAKDPVWKGLRLAAPPKVGDFIQYGKKIAKVQAVLLIEQSQTMTVYARDEGYFKEHIAELEEEG